MDQKFLIVVEHMQSTFEVAEEHGDSLDALLVRQILQTGFLNLVVGNAFLAVIFRLEIQLFQLVIREREEVP